MVLAGCSGATAVHAFDFLNNNLLGRTVVIQGGGPLGMFSCTLARYLGAENVILIYRKEFSIQERKQKILDITHGRYADIVYRSYRK